SSGRGRASAWRSSLRRNFERNVLGDQPLEFRKVLLVPVRGAVERGDTLAVDVDRPGRPDAGEFFLPLMEAVVDPGDVRGIVLPRVRFLQPRVLDDPVSDLRELLGLLEPLLHAG